MTVTIARERLRHALHNVLFYFLNRYNTTFAPLVSRAAGVS